MRNHINLVESMMDFEPSPQFVKLEQAVDKISTMAMQQATREVAACIKQIKKLYPQSVISWHSGQGSTSIEFSPPLQFAEYTLDVLINEVGRDDYSRVGDDANGHQMLNLAAQAFAINEYVSDTFKVEADEVRL